MKGLKKGRDEYKQCPQEEHSGQREQGGDRKAKAYLDQGQEKDVGWDTGQDLVEPCRSLKKRLTFILSEKRASRTFERRSDIMGPHFNPVNGRSIDTSYKTFG